MEVVPSSARPNVLFATPSFDKTVSVAYLASMVGTIGEMYRHGMACGLHVVAGNQFVDLARNELVDYFLKSEEGFTDILFMDADQGWDPKVIPRLISHYRGVVAALPPKKCKEPTFHSGAMTGVVEDGLFQSHEAGTGCMRIKRSVFEQMDAAYPELKEMVGPNAWNYTPYFQRGNTKYGGFLGEDIFFCRQLLGMGEYVWIDSDMTFTHHGGRIWTGNLYDHLIETGKLLKSA